jgi:asparagine synthase (glutamine-hydrolysing)
MKQASLTAKGVQLLQVDIVDPDVVVIEKPDAIWLLLAAGGSQRTEPVVEEFWDSDAAESFCRQQGDAAVIGITREGCIPHCVEIWRGVTGGYEVFFLQRPDGKLWISDHFRSLLAQVPVGERSISEDAVLDHFLYRTVSGTLTYCSQVQRSAQGERTTIDCRNGSVRRRIFDRLEGDPSKASIEDYVEGIDKALATVLDPLRQSKKIATMFSGGVDSTLLQTYLRPDVPALNLVFDSAGLSGEDAYARHAAELLGVEMERVLVRATDFRQHLETAVSAIGMPPHFLQWVVENQVFTTGYERFITGDRADILFGGLGGLNGGLARYFASPFAAQGWLLAARCLPGNTMRHWRHNCLFAERMCRDPLSPYGYGSLHRTFSDLPLIEKVFGRNRVRERLEVRLAYVTERCALLGPKASRFDRHREVCTMVDFLCEESLMLLRQLALASGKALYSPFVHRVVVDSALAVPSPERPSRGLRTKHLLKDLLRKRLPAYPVDQKKYFLDIPFAEHFHTGSLSGIWQDYTVPEMFEGEVRARLTAESSQTTWNAITFAVFQETVLRNPNLAAAPATVSLSLEEGDAAAST